MFKGQTSAIYHVRRFSSSGSEKMEQEKPTEKELAEWYNSRIMSTSDQLIERIVPTTPRA